MASCRPTRMSSDDIQFYFEQLGLWGRAQAYLDERRGCYGGDVSKAEAERRAWLGLRQMVGKWTDELLAGPDPGMAQRIRDVKAEVKERSVGGYVVKGARASKRAASAAGQQGGGAGGGVVATNGGVPLPRGAMELLRAAKDRKADKLTEVEWVAANLLLPWRDLDPELVPSAGALGLLCFAHSDPVKFYTLYDAKLLPDRKALADVRRFEDDGRPQRELAERLAKIADGREDEGVVKIVKVG